VRIGCRRRTIRREQSLNASRMRRNQLNETSIIRNMIRFPILIPLYTPFQCGQMLRDNDAGCLVYGIVFVSRPYNFIPGVRECMHYTYLSLSPKLLEDSGVQTKNQIPSHPVRIGFHPRFLISTFISFDIKGSHVSCVSSLSYPVTHQSTL
jgi:hypothetical protein